jgi:hypothetical protein
MNQFKDFGIKPAEQAFKGNKIEIHQILNTEIVVHKFKIGVSKYKEKGNGKCLQMQIEMDGTMRVVFTGSGVLMNTLEQIDEYPGTN